MDRKLMEAIQFRLDVARDQATSITRNPKEWLSKVEELASLVNNQNQETASRLTELLIEHHKDKEEGIGKLNVIASHGGNLDDRPPLPLICEMEIIVELALINLGHIASEELSRVYFSLSYGSSKKLVLLWPLATIGDPHQEHFFQSLSKEELKMSFEAREREAIESAKPIYEELQIPEDDVLISDQEIEDYISNLREEYKKAKDRN